jgi:predicted small secreted protein
MTEQSTMKNAVTFTAVMFGLLLTGCNTVNGAGKDVKSAGTTLSDVSGKSGKN